MQALQACRRNRRSAIPAAHHPACAHAPGGSRRRPRSAAGRPASCRRKCARSTASQAVRSPSCSRARVSATRSRIAGRSSSDSSSTPRYSIPASRKAARIGGSDGRPRTRTAIDGGLPSAASALPDNAHDFRGHRACIGLDERMHVDAVLGRARLCRDRGRIAHRAAFEIVLRRHARLQMSRSPNRRWRRSNENSGPGAPRRSGTAPMPRRWACRNSGHVRFPERIDRLHRIANAEEAPAVAGLPTGDQEFQQALLRRRRVLVFVDQQVMDAIVEREARAPLERTRRRVHRGPRPRRPDGRDCPARRRARATAPPRAAAPPRVRQCVPTAHP